MHLDSIVSINSNKQHTRQSTQNTGSLAGSAAKVLFSDYLNAHIQKASTPEITRQAESHVAGLLMGYISPLRITYKSEPELEISAG